MPAGVNGDDCERGSSADLRPEDLLRQPCTMTPSEIFEQSLRMRVSPTDLLASPGGGLNFEVALMWFSKWFNGRK